MFKWFKLLRNKGYTLYQSIDGAIYNNKIWHPEGEWPYAMKKRDKSQHRLYTTKYEDLCM